MWGLETKWQRGGDVSMGPRQHRARGTAWLKEIAQFVVGPLSKHKKGERLLIWSFYYASMIFVFWHWAHFCCLAKSPRAVVGIYRVSSLDKKQNFIAHKQIKNQYTSIITWLKPSKREIVHDLSQRDHFRQFINIKRKVTYVYLING